MTYIYRIDETRRKTTLYKRNEIEAALIKQNSKHFRKVINTEVHKEKIYDKLKSNEVRDRILNRILQRDECNSEDACKFLLLLQC